MAGVDLFDRRWRVVIDTIEIEALDVHFDIERSGKPEPNSCELTIFNLKREQIAQIEALDSETKQATTGIPCLIEAGYASGMSQIWLGDLRTAQTVTDGPDRVTTIGSGDGEKAWRNARLHLNYGPKTQLDTALRAIVRALGVGEGNLSKVVAKLKQAGSAIFPTGKTFSGNAAKALVDFARSADLEVSIQDGALQFIDRGKALADEAILLDSAHGMIGAPTVDNEGMLTVETLMIPDVRPGRLVEVAGIDVKGNYKIERAQCSGQSDGDKWGYTLECKRY